MAPIKVLRMLNHLRVSLKYQENGCILKNSQTHNSVHTLLTYATVGLPS